MKAVIAKQLSGLPFISSPEIQEEAVYSGSLLMKKMVLWMNKRLRHSQQQEFQHQHQFFSHQPLQTPRKEAFSLLEMVCWSTVPEITLVRLVEIYKEKQFSS